MPAISVHAHFYHPSRGNPLTHRIGIERSAAPYRNWNERMNAEVYRPNAQLNNFQLLNFDLEESFVDWLRTHDESTYKHLLHAVKGYHQQHHSTNMLATPYHQSPLPLLSHKDRVTQLRWGKSAIQQRYGIEPGGVLLPEFAVDYATLQAVVEAGFSYTVLRSSQVEGMPKRGGAGPYTLTLPKTNDKLTVFVIDDKLSKSMLKNMVELSGSGHWSRHELLPYRRQTGALSLLYLDGDMLGMNKMSEATFINYLLQNEIRAAGFTPTTLEAYFNDAPKPVANIQLLPYEHDEHTLQRQLRDTLHDLMTEADLLMVDVRGEKAWSERDKLFSTPEMPDALMHSQIMLQRAWAQTASLEHYMDVTIHHVLDSVAVAVVLIRASTGTDLSAIFTERLNAENTDSFRTALDTMQESYQKGVFNQEAFAG